MQFQSKKLNHFPVSIAAVFFLSLLYWSYLALTTRMEIVFDSIGYQSLGRMLESQSWTVYFSSGPHREPLYPLLIAAAMRLEHLTGFAYVKIMCFFGMIIMFLTQVLSYKIMRLLNIRQGICMLILIYLGISPALNNSAFSLFSEIGTYPLVLGILLTSYYLWDAINQEHKKHVLLLSLLLGILLTLATLIKGVFECVAPIYLIIFFLKAKRNKALLLSIIVTLGCFYIPITSYKWLNWHYNGTFAVTDRGSSMVYGNAARDTEPLTLKKFGAALASVPGVGVCPKYFSQENCDFWAFQESDAIGSEKVTELNKQHLNGTQTDATLIHLAIQKVRQKPFQYILISSIEAFKMFFWESTKIGFVAYPEWLSKIYSIKIFNNGLRLLMSLASFVAVFFLWLQIVTQKSPPFACLIGAMILIYIFFFIFVCVLTRYALPISPLYLITIGLWLNQKLPHKKLD